MARKGRPKLTLRVYFVVQLPCGHWSPMTSSDLGNVRHPRIREKAEKMVKNPQCVHPMCAGNTKTVMLDQAAS